MTSTTQARKDISTSAAQPRQRKRGILWWASRILLGLAMLLVILISIVLVAGARARAVLKAQYPPIGQMVDVGGYKLHIACQGAGSPTVVMDTGLGHPSLVWALVQPEVAQSVRVCIYDRAGYGWSEPSPRPRTSPVIVMELHTLLANTGIPGPYVLVGHSFGGVNMRLYAHTYPEEVVGMVLVDSAHEEQLLRFPEAYLNLGKQFEAQAQRQLRLGKRLAAVGVLALRPALYPAPPGLPPQVTETYQALAVLDARMMEAVSDETTAIEESHALVRAAHITTLGDIPLIVLSRGRQDPLPASLNIDPKVLQEGEQVWGELQTELAALSPQGKRVVAQQSGHNIHLEQPELVIDAIREVLVTARR